MKPFCSKARISALNLKYVHVFYHFRNARCLSGQRSVCLSLYKFTLAFCVAKIGLKELESSSLYSLEMSCLGPKYLRQGRMNASKGHSERSRAKSLVRLVA